MNTVSIRPHRVIYNRLAAVMLHIPWYTFHGQVRLANDAGVSPSNVCRLLAGQSVPSFPIACAITEAMELRLGKKLDMRELISLDGSYLTPNVCHLVGCRGCLPAFAYNEESDTLLPEFRSVRPGTWSLSQPSLLKATHQLLQGGPMI